MSFKPQFYYCKHCKQVIGVVNDAGVRMTCCGEPMTYLEPNTSDGATEKHVPVVEVTEKEVTVKIGSVAHPMTEEHYIEWVYLFQENGGQRRILKPGDTPEVVFNVEAGKPFAVFALCNLHGLWKTEL